MSELGEPNGFLRFHNLVQSAIVPDADRTHSGMASDQPDVTARPRAERILLEHFEDHCESLHHMLGQVVQLLLCPFVYEYPIGGQGAHALRFRFSKT